MSLYPQTRQNSNSGPGLRVLRPTSRSFDVKSKTTGSIFVEKPEIFEDLVSDVYSKERRRYGQTEYLGRLERSPRGLTSTDVQRQLLRDALQTDAKKLERITKENIDRSIRRKNAKNEATFSRLVADVNECRTKLDAVDKSLELIEETKRNKLRRQFEDWNTQVHGVIQVNIARQVDAIDSKSLNKKRNEDYAKFLDVSNRKAAIFRDIIIESEYDPLEPNRRALKATTRKLVDPCKIEQQKADEEAAMLGSPSGMKKSATKLGKDTLPVEHWATGKIEATPFGTFAKMMGSADSERRPPKSPNLTQRSTIKFDDFSFPKGRDAIDAEMPRGKRVYPTTIYSNPSDVFGSSIKF